MPQPPQLQFFPRKAVIEYPPAQLTADSAGEAEADDGFRYYIKDDKGGAQVRASEWISTHVAEAVGIAAPAAIGIELANGRVVFGSRRIAGVADALVTQTFLTTPSASNTNPQIFGLSSLLSKIYALDMFLFNVDRHLGNYLSIDDQGVRRLYTFDFSRALFWAWPWQGFPLPNCNTRRWGGVLRSLHGFDLTAAASVLDNIEGLKSDTLISFVKQMPADWTDQTTCDDLAKMWANGTAAQRAQELRKGLSDGTLL